MTDWLLAADIGGTHTWLALAPAATPDRPAHRARFDNAAWPDFEALLAAFLDEAGARPACACLAVAAPVAPGQRVAVLTNRTWRIDTDRLSARLGGVPVCLVNDFAAVAHAVPHLDPEHLVPVQPGTADPEAPAALMGAGTGLGQALLLECRETGRFHVLPTEGGHSDFAPQCEEDWSLLRRLQRLYGTHVSWERVLSGRGLVELYRFHCGPAPHPDFAAAEAAGADPAPVVTRLGLHGGDPAAEQALRHFTRLYGAQAGNLALQSLCRRGLFIGGGIARHLLPYLVSATFLEAFLAKGRFRALLDTLPVHVIVHPWPGLLGALVLAGRTGTPGRGS